jgi:hypothetical protein
MPDLLALAARGECTDCGGAIRWIDDPAERERLVLELEDGRGVLTLLGEVTAAWVCGNCGEMGFFGGPVVGGAR